jgi:hypothetical protein
MDDRDLLRRAKEYAKYKAIRLDLEERLGWGSDGTVWRTSAGSAVKILALQKNYSDELTAYQRLRAESVDEINGFAIPKLLDSHDGLLAIEMSVVQRPFLLDFGKIYLDRPPPYWADAQLMQNAHAEWRELFGERWPKVSAARQSFAYGSAFTTLTQSLETSFFAKTKTEGRAPVG